MRTFLLRTSAAAVVVLGAASANAGLISAENALPGVSPAGSWVNQDDGTAAGTGVCDVYPGAWSIKQGDSIAFKVRSTTTYDLRIMRLGYYGNAGAREVKVITGNAADPQPYPRADATFGMAAAGWHDSVTVTTDTVSWTPGVYVARVEQPGGKQAETVFVIRDDALATGKLPVLFVLATATHQAYNAWPGAANGGKSFYAFNCSPDAVSQDTIVPPVQAVKVSFDRPFYVGGGTADITRSEYPFFRWLEKVGTWDVAYAMDQDFHNNPGLMMGRKAVVFVGHSEYWSGAMFDAAIAARDSGVNMLWATGDSVSWQVRFEAGTAGATSTMVGYKENYSKDPEWKAGAADATRPWKVMGRPGMLITGVQSSGQIRDATGTPKPDYAFDASGASDIGWADLVVNYAGHWLFAGTGMVAGDRIKNVMGYEVDSTLQGDPTFDPYRPPGQTILGTIVQDSDGKRKGASGYYRVGTTGAEVIGLGAIAWSWALDDYAEQQSSAPPPPSSVDTRAQKMMTNVFDRWVGGVVLDVDAGPPPDAGKDPDAVPPDDAIVDEVGFDAAGIDVVLPDTTPVVDTAPLDDTAVAPDTDLADTTVSADSLVTDSAVADSATADSTVADSTAADTSGGSDSTIADSSVGTDTTTGGDTAASGSDTRPGTYPEAGPLDTGEAPNGDTGSAGGSGCSCDVPSSSTAPGDALAFALGGIALVAARRRRRTS